MIVIRYGDEVHKVDIIPEQKAYAGQVGRQRREFCVDFISNKSKNYRRIQASIFVRVKSSRETITCHKGCSVCCVHYVEASLQECDAIAYHLYQNPDVMDLFLSQYEAWRGRMRSLGDPFLRCEEVLHEKEESEISQSDQAVLMDALSHYHEQDIQCPFLSNGSCSIYNVRPYICVNHYVTTPQEWCRASYCCCPQPPQHPKVYMTEIDDLLYERSFYYRNLSKPAIGFMSTSVYRILTEGLSYIAARAGFDEMSTSSCMRSEPA